MLIVKDKPHKLPEKQLRLILNLLEDAFEENGDAPSDGADFFENYLNIVDDALKYVNIIPNDIKDYSFIGELYFLNKDNNSSNIIIPTPKVFNVYHKETRSDHLSRTKPLRRCECQSRTKSKRPQNTRRQD